MPIISEKGSLVTYYDRTKKHHESPHGKYWFSAKIQNGRLSTSCFLNARHFGTKWDRNTVDVWFWTDNRMADLLDILSRSSEVKVVRQSQVKRKSWPKYGSIVLSTAHNVSFNTRIEIMGCFGMSIDNTASRLCFMIKVKVVYEKKPMLSKIVHWLSLKNAGMLICARNYQIGKYWIYSTTVVSYVHLIIYTTSRGTRWGKSISVSDLELYEI